MKMLDTLAQAIRLPDLRQRFYFMLGAFAVFILGRHIPLPGVDREMMARLFEHGGVVGLIDIFSGGALRRFSIFALGIMPYINASIIMQLLTVALPQLEELAKEGGEAGRRQIARYTRYLTVALAFVQGLGLTTWLRGLGIFEASVLTQMVILIELTAGTSFLMWLGEELTEKGIGNGVSLIIFLGIMAALPQEIWQTAQLILTGAVTPFQVFLLAAIFVFSMAGIIFIQQGERRIPVQYAKRIIGNRMVGGASSYLPLKVNTAGVIPIIFALSVAYFPATVVNFLPPSPGTWWEKFTHIVNDYFTPGHGWVADFLYFGLVVVFTYFYTAVVFDVNDFADNLKKWGGFIPGIRPGRQTARYLDRLLTRITFFGALFLGVIALLQFWVPKITGIQSFSLIGGTSILIVVGVALETMQQIEAHLLMRHYEGFIR